jgi:hypothetical protein
VIDVTAVDPGLVEVDGFDAYRHGWVSWRST